MRHMLTDVVKRQEGHALPVTKKPTLVDVRWLGMLASSGMYGNDAQNAQRR